MRMRIILTWRRVAGLVALAIFGALFVSWTGLVSIAASSGHWSATAWFLGWTMENAAATQSMSVSKPEHIDLDDPALVRRSAGHFATGCAACHGAPGAPQSPVVKAMVPAPPRLEEKVGAWTDAQLFWIVKNGVKFSGMPAWPAQDRDDEVWAQVAFLRALPGMSPAEYDGLALGGGPAGGASEVGETVALLDGAFEIALADCSRCHGRDGLGRGDGEAANAFPIIAGQPAPYLMATLGAFASGLRSSGFMEPPANRYPAAVLDALARHYSRQPGPQQSAAADIDLTPGARSFLPATPALASLPDTWQDAAGILEVEGEPTDAFRSRETPDTRRTLRAFGKRVAIEGVERRGVPACQSCHGAVGRRNNPLYPHLGGQPAWYLAEHLRLWRAGVRGGTAYSTVMDAVARNMTDVEIEAVAAWYSDLRYTPH